MPITLQEVAAAAGVNRTTASLVLNRHPGAAKFSAATRERILTTARTLGYRPNAAARALVTRRNHTIGLAIPATAEGQWRNVVYAAELNGALRACRERGYNLIPFSCHADEVEELALPGGGAERCVDGLLLAGSIPAAAVERFRALNLPAIQIGLMSAPPFDLPIFSPAIVSGLRQAVEYLARLGHRRIALQDTGTPASDETYRRLSAEPLPAEAVRFSTPDERCDFSSGRIFMADYFALPEAGRPTALITNPQTCLGVRRELALYRLHSPEQLSIVSRIDDDLFDYLDDGFTALHFDLEGIAAAAARALIDRVESGLPIQSRTDFPVSLVIRQSTGAAPL